MNRMTQNAVMYHMSDTKNKKALKFLLQQAENLNVKVRFHKPKERAFDGEYSIDVKQINIVGSKPFHRMLFILAHEVRHAQHHFAGMYALYYSDTYIKESVESVDNWSSSNASVLYAKLTPFILMGARAENDCNKYAISVLRRFGLRANNEHYPVCGVSGYELWSFVRERIKECSVR